MAVSELLKLIIDADTSGAVRGITNLGAASKRELTRSEQLAQKWGNALTQAGAGMIALGAVGVAGLVKAAQASEEANLSVVKLENTLANMPALAGESSGQFIDLADSIQDVTAADADQIVAAEAMLGTFRLTASEIKQITPLVVDYARKFDVDLVSAATQVGKALDGQVGALKRNGVSIDEAAFAADRFSAVQQALSEQVGGFAEAEGKTFAGSLERLKNEMGDLAEGVGVGAVDAFSSMFGVVEGLSDRLNELSPEAQSAIGKFATFGSVGLIAAGGLSILIGQTIKMRDNFILAREAVANFAGSGGLGRLTRAGLVVGGLIVLREALMALDDDLDNIDVSTLENQLLDLAETGEFSAGQLKDVFDGLGDALSGGDPQAIEAWADQIGEVDKALASLAGRSPEKAAEAFAVISSALRDQGATAAQVKTLFDDYAAAVANADTAARTGAGGVDEFTESTEEATSALQEYSDQLTAMTDPQFAMIDAMRDSVAAQTELRDATAALAEARATGDVEAVTEAEERYSDAVHGARSSVVDLQVAANTLKDAMAEQGLTAADVEAEFVALAQQQGFTADEALIMAQAFGVATDEANTLGRTDPNVDVSETGTATTRDRLRRTKEDAFAIPQARNVAVSATGYGNVAQLVDRINNKMAQLHDRTLTVRTNFVTTGQGGSGGIPIFHEGGVVPGPRGQELLAIVQAGEHITSLQDMDRIGRGAPMADGGSTIVDNRTFNIVTGADPQGVVEAIKRYERQNGRGWRS